jgi:hypothetical protein
MAKVTRQHPGDNGSASANPDDEIGSVASLSHFVQEFPYQPINMSPAKSTTILELINK